MSGWPHSPTLKYTFWHVPPFVSLHPLRPFPLAICYALLGIAFLRYFLCTILYRVPCLHAHCAGLIVLRRYSRNNIEPRLL
jgi:hypothetical protein